MNEIAIATIASFVAAIGWLILVYRVDRYKKEPISLIIKVFLTSCGFSFIAGFLNSISATLFGVLGMLITVGPIEECMKFLPVWLIAFKHKEFDAPIDGVIYASASALGFAFMENIEYNFAILDFFKSDAASPLLDRSLAPLMHVLISSIWGYGLGYYKSYIGSKKFLIITFLIAAFTHSFYDIFIVAFVDYRIFILLFMGVFYFAIKHLNRISPKNTAPHLFKCPKCSQKIPINSLYCSHCGKHLFLFKNVDIYCKNCKSKILEHWQFCKNCGIKLHE